MGADLKVTDPVTGEVTGEVEAQEAQVGAQEAQVVLTTVEKTILESCKNTPKTGQELVIASGYSTRTGHFKRSVEKLLMLRLIEMTIPSKPRSSKQKYRLTEKGKMWLESAASAG